MTRRMDSVNVLLRQEISRVLATELKDPRLSTIVTVTDVDAAPDLRRAKVFVSVLGDRAEKKSTLKGLKSAAGFIHRSLRKRVALKSVPSLEFYLDESIEQGTDILQLINDLARQTETIEPA